MKKILSSKITVIILLLVTVIFLGFYTYMLARPISYGMVYHNSSVYEGEEFEGRMEFYSDSTMLTKNNNFNEGLKSYYYYKNGYIFFTMAETEEQYQAEVDIINADFESAVNLPFYAAKANAFRLVSVGPDGYTLVYTCAFAIAFAVVGGVIGLALLGAGITAFVLFKKARK